MMAFINECGQKKKKKSRKKKKKSRKKKKTKSNARKRSGDNEKAILWTPLLTPFAQTDMLGPKGLGFLLYGEWVERNLTGHMLVQSMVLVGCT
jgi:hypothetical protein